jgi:hypothetical protein
MKLFNKIKKVYETPTMKLQKVKPTFITNDGIEHTGLNYKWANSSGLLCSVGEYIMTDIKMDGYIYDEDKIMYPLANVKSIKWNVVKEKIVKEVYSKYRNIFFDDEEADKMVEIIQ